MRKRKTRNRSTGDDGEGLSLPDTSYNAEPEVTPGLVPTGIPGIYQSPVEAVDPYDCERWSNSPYCGGDLLNDELISLTPEISINPCETCVTISPVLGRISLPPYTICKRSDDPECVPRVPRQNIPEVPTPESLQNPRRSCGEGTYKILVNEKYLETRIVNTNEIVTAHIPQDTEYGDALSIELDWNHRVQDANLRAGMLTPGSRITGIISEGFFPHESQSNPYITCRVVLDGTDGVITTIANYVSPGVYNSGIRTVYNVASDFGEYTVARSRIRYYLNYGYLDSILPQCINAFPNDEPVGAPPYPPNRGCCMSCCNSREAEENNELLRLIARRLGTSDYPFTVPANLLASRSRRAKKLESNAQVWEWFIRQFDALAGQFPIEIEIQDADPTKQGDQAAKIKVDNISEALAELLGIGINTSINTESLVNIGIRTLTEAGMAKNAAIVAQDLGLANAEFLDYELKQITRKIPSTFTPGKVELDDILQESTQQIRSYENVDDHQLKDYMTELLQGVAIIRAAFWRKLDPNKPYSSQIRSLLRNLVSLADNDLTKDENGRPKEKTPTEDFDSFLEQVERGFADQPGIQDATKPYGRSPESRPRIRELGDQSEG